MHLFEQLIATANCCGRSLPICWITVPKEDLAKNMTETERKLLRALHQMIPAHIQVILLADRGFAKEEAIHINGRGQDHLPPASPPWSGRASWTFIKPPMPRDRGRGAARRLLCAASAGVGC